MQLLFRSFNPAHDDDAIDDVPQKADVGIPTYRWWQKDFPFFPATAGVRASAADERRCWCLVLVRYRQRTTAASYPSTSTTKRMDTRTTMTTTVMICIFPDWGVWEKAAIPWPKRSNLLITDANAFWWEFVLIAWNVSSHPCVWLAFRGLTLGMCQVRVSGNKSIQWILGNAKLHIA